MSSSGGSISAWVGGHATAVVIAVVAVATGAALVPVVTGGGGGDPTANVWVVSGGSTCTRRSTPVDYASSATGTDSRCGTFDQAYDAMSCGDTGRIQPGDYTSQAVTGTKSCSGATQVTLRASTDSASATWGDQVGTVTVDVLDLGASSTALDDLMVRDITVTDPSVVCSSGSACGNNKIVDMNDTTNVDMDHVTVDRNYLVGDGLGMSGENTDNDITNFDICCNAETKLIQIQQFQGTFAVQNFRMENVNCHDQVYTATSYPGGAPHNECLWLTGESDTVSFINFRCWHATSTGCMNWGGLGQFGGRKTNVLFRNCLMGAKYDYVGGVDVLPGAAVGYRGNSGAQTIAGEAIDATGTFEYCVVDGTADFDAWDSLAIRGSVINQSGCAGQGDNGTGANVTTYTYTIQVGGSCGTNATNVASGLFSATNFTDTAAGDYSPATGSSVQCGKGDPGSFPSTDALGTTRASPPDAGLYEC